MKQFELLDLDNGCIYPIPACMWQLIDYLKAIGWEIEYDFRD